MKNCSSREEVLSDCVLPKGRNMSEVYMGIDKFREG